MSHLLTSGQVGNIGNAHFKTVRESVQKRWNDLGFLEGLNGTVKENIAQLYENSASSLLRESTTTGDASGSFETVVFPIVRRVFSKLLANDIVSVQAMNMPIGKLFFFVPVTSERDEDGGHRSLTSEHLPEEVYSDNTADSFSAANQKWMTKSLYDLYYNDGLFDNSKGKINLQTSEGGNVTFQTMKFDGSKLVPATTLPTHNDGSVRNAILEVSGFNAADAGRLIGPDGNQMDTESFLASLKIVAVAAILDPLGETIIPAGGEIPFRLVTQKYGKGIVDYGSICDAVGKLYIDLDLSHPVLAGNTTSADGYIGANAFTATHLGDLVTATVAAADIEEGKTYEIITVGDTDFTLIGASANTVGVRFVATRTLTAGEADGAGDGTVEDITAGSAELIVAWSQYESLELETEMGEVSFKLDEVVVSVEERKLRATWSPELAQDVSAFHNIDAEAELTAMLSEQVASEIDREILRDLRKAAAWTMRWDYSGWRKTAQASNAYTQKDWNQTLITKVNQISAQIHKTTLRGGANFIVVSSEISAIFDDLEYFHVSDASAEQDEYNMGIEKVGSLSGRYQVYRDPYAPAHSIIIGHKGKSLLDTGYIYAPYVPLQLTPTMYNPMNFAPVKGIMTRYAKKVVNNRFYGHIQVDNIPTFNINELR